MIAHPPLRYHGSKWRLAPWIIDRFPPHRLYCEPFGGGAAILLRMMPSEVEIYNDIDGRVVNFFRMVREQTSELMVQLLLTPYARADPMVALAGPTRAQRATAGAVQRLGADNPVSPIGGRMQLSIAHLMVIIDTLIGSLSIVDNSSYLFKYSTASRQTVLQSLQKQLNELHVTLELDKRESTG